MRRDDDLENLLAIDRIVDPGAEIRGSASTLLADLRNLYETRPALAQHLIWQLLHSIRGRHAVGLADELFSAGVRPDELDGEPADFTLVTFSVFAPLDILVGAMYSNWPGKLPWQGKSFDKVTGVGQNHLPMYLWPVVPLTRLMAPGHRIMRRTGAGIAGFGFAIRPGMSLIEPGRAVMTLDYGDPKSGNPRIAGRLQDEVVELVPGVVLGRMVLRLFGKHYFNGGYFAVRPAPAQR